MDIYVTWSVYFVIINIDKYNNAGGIFPCFWKSDYPSNGTAGAIFRELSLIRIEKGRLVYKNTYITSLNCMAMAAATESLNGFSTLF